MVCLDGNVLMQAIPQNVKTLEEHASFFTSALKKAMASAAVVIVVYDEPALLTEAKIEEMAKRDSARAKREVPCSEDLALPRDDAYTLEQLESMPDVSGLRGVRAARGRFFDAVAVQALQWLKNTIREWCRSGYQTALVFDGLDPRGARRSLGDARLPQIWGSDAAVCAALAHAPLGEGDLKLAAIENVVLAAASSTERPLGDTRLFVASTIDTDNFALELLEHWRREAGEDRSKRVQVVFAMREIARSEEESASYLVCDVRQLYCLVLRAVWPLRQEPTPTEARAAIALLVAGWALCGCDFTKVPGLNASLTFEAVSSLIKQDPDALHAIQAAWAGGRDEVLGIERTLRRLVMLCATCLGERKGSEAGDQVCACQRRKRASAPRLLHDLLLVLQRA